MSVAPWGAVRAVAMPVLATAGSVARWFSKFFVYVCFGLCVICSVFPLYSWAQVEGSQVRRGQAAGVLQFALSKVERLIDSKDMACLAVHAI